jgi:putative DNA modification/repair radical SAM protein
VNTQEKLEVLSGAARYDASCASSGSSRSGNGGGVGSACTSGICHSWSADGRCISLLKILYSNACRYDCAYCINRCSNDHERATFTPEEVARLTMDFYRRNYIEGLFLSSGVVRSPDDTMAGMIQAVELLRHRDRFHGYTHLKIIPGTSPELVQRAGFLADRVSVNIELPSAESLQLLAPDKARDAIVAPMRRIGAAYEHFQAERKLCRHAPVFAPAGQSTQLIVGASPETDGQILHLSEALYGRVNLKRVYYSAYVPVNQDPRLPVFTSDVPLLREHRLYQADWLLRFYDFRAEELLPGTGFNLDLDLDPKAAWALRNLWFFPVDVAVADLNTLLRVPGVGPTSARRILGSRRHTRITERDLRHMGVVLKRAAPFLAVKGRRLSPIPLDARVMQPLLRPRGVTEKRLERLRQPSLFEYAAQQRAASLPAVAPSPPALPA